MVSFQHGPALREGAGTRAITKAAGAGLALVASLLLGELPIDLRAPEEVPDDEEPVGSAGPEELHSSTETGTAASALMPFKRWNRVYWTSAPHGNQGIVILLVSKVKGSQGSWTALDPTGRI